VRCWPFEDFGSLKRERGVSKMKCPSCHARLSFGHMYKHRCPTCGTKVYFSPRWPWLRGICCGLLTVLLTYRLYPLGGSFTAQLFWLALVLLVFIALLFSLFYVIPPEIDLVEEGPHALTSSAPWSWLGW
jgi:hypothetical protein